MTSRLIIERIERELVNGSTETLVFQSGVNLLVGKPNTGKSQWLETLDYLLGDSGQPPFSGAVEGGLSDKYAAARATLLIDGKPVAIERRWRERGTLSKVFVDGASLSTKEFQDHLLELLHIPLLHFPKGNPMSGQTWPELSFRMMLRHMYRRQQFWSDLADLQPLPEQLACILQFLGLAETVYSEQYGRMVKLKIEVYRLKARRAQYGQTLSDLAKELLAEEDRGVEVSAISVARARVGVRAQLDSLQAQREQILVSAQNEAATGVVGATVSSLIQRHADLLAAAESLAARQSEIDARARDIRRYRTDLTDELDRMQRLSESGSVLADLRVTHCPACDQPVERPAPDPEHCFVCEQALPAPASIPGLGSARVQFEVTRLSAEALEANELISSIELDLAKTRDELRTTKERIARVSAELAPARAAVSALAQSQVSAIDRQLGELTERERQLSRIASAVDLSENLDQQIEALLKAIAPLEGRVDRALETLDFDQAAQLLADGMNEYLNAINQYGDGVWSHSQVRVTLTDTRFAVKVGTRPWATALGGTDQLYLLMAYHYGLMALTNRPSTHYPGLLVVDVPAEFAADKVEDIDDFVVKPFIDLLGREEYEGTQMIITGAAYSGLNTKRITLEQVHVA